LSCTSEKSSKKVLIKNSYSIKMEPTENFEISSLEDLFENAKMTVSTTDFDKYENALYYEIFIKEEYAIAKSTIQKAKTILDI